MFKIYSGLRATLNLIVTNLNFVIVTRNLEVLFKYLNHDTWLL